MIVITGGAGFIGSNLAAALEERGESEIVICDRFGPGDKWRNLGKRELALLLPPEELLDYLEDQGPKIQAVFHMGAISSTTEPDIDLTLQTNFTLSQKLWRWCTNTGTRFIYASSAATYGDGSAGFDDNSAALGTLRPLNAYGWSKHLFDRRVMRLSAGRGSRASQWVGLKFFNVYGPNEYHKGSMRSVVHQVFEGVRAGKRATLFRSHNPQYADGGQLRDFIYVRDCVSVILWLYDNPDVSGLFNCGTGQARSFKDLAEAVFRALGKEPEIDYIDTPLEIRDKYQYFTEARMDRLRAAGYQGTPTPLEEGVRDYVQSFLTAPDPYR